MSAKKVVHGRIGGVLNMTAAKEGQTWQSSQTYCGMKMAFPPNLYEVAELDSHHITCKKCLKKIAAVKGI